jgi:formate dehydrogenase subunit gamma
MGDVGMKNCMRFRGLTGALTLALAVAGGIAAGFVGSPHVIKTAAAQASLQAPLSEPSPTTGNVPGQSLGNASDTEIWRQVRRGVVGNVSIPDRMAGILVQSEGESWRALRNGPISRYGSLLLLLSLFVVGIFFAARGRVRIDAGPSGRTVQRFSAIERFTHWLTASSFIVLGLTGLNMLYGRYVLKPLIGAEAFSLLSLGGKYAHNYIAFAFMLGVAMMVVLWVRHNLPDRHDLVWLAKGGGLFAKGVHPPSKKFNAGQKIQFWIVVLGGLSASLSGIVLMFPFEFAMLANTFEVVNLVGFSLPTALTPLQEMQLSQLWHVITGLILIGVIITHIYIGSLGMEGAFDAMGTGMVDENWARQHHDLWYADLKGEPVAAADHGDD